MRTGSVLRSESSLPLPPGLHVAKISAHWWFSPLVIPPQSLSLILLRFLTSEYWRALSVVPEPFLFSIHVHFLDDLIQSHRFNSICLLIASKYIL